MGSVSLQAAPTKWTRADVKRCCDVLNSLHTCNRPLDRRLDETSTFDERFRALLVEHRREWVLAGLRSHITTARDRARQCTDTAAHYRTMADIWKRDTSDTVDRFVRLATAEEVGVAPFQRLIARIEREGLPPAVEQYDPTVRP